MVQIAASPIAKATEILGERWTFLIVRELLMGGRRFSELQRGLGEMSPALLTARLKSFEVEGLVARRRINGQRGYEYHPTPACEALLPVVMAMGEWGIPVRGGIDIGVGVDLYPNEVYGPVAASAYKLESEVADYPRIVIGSGLLDYVLWLESTRGSDWNAVKTRELATTCREVVCDGGNHMSMLHLLAGSVLRISPENLARVPKLLNWVRTELERHRAAGNDTHDELKKAFHATLEGTYRRLLDYLEREGRYDRS